MPDSASSRTVGSLLDAFASNQPVPGGGSAAALAGAVGTSVLIMVASLPKTRTGAQSERDALDAAAVRLRPLREALTGLIDRDSDAYSNVVAAYRLAKGTDAEQSARRRAIEDAMRAATETPLETMRACQQALADAVVVAGGGVKSASSDAGVAIELLCAALRGAALNVDTNIGALADRAVAERMRQERQDLERRGAADAARARALLV
jgi:formiminotetrahydrofolate cyclodeaminase